MPCNLLFDGRRLLPGPILSSLMEGGQCHSLLLPLQLSEKVVCLFQCISAIVEEAQFKGRGMWRQLSAWLVSPGILDLYLRAVLQVYNIARSISADAFSGHGPFLSNRCIFLLECISCSLTSAINLVVDVQQSMPSTAGGNSLLPQVVNMVRMQLRFSLPFIVNTLRKDLASYVKPVTFVVDWETILSGGFSTFRLLSKFAVSSVKTPAHPFKNQPWIIKLLYPDIVDSFPSLVGMLGLARGYGIILLEDPSNRRLLRECIPVLEDLFPCLQRMPRSVVEPCWAMLCVGTVQLSDFVLSEIEISDTVLRRIQQKIISSGRQTDSSSWPPSIIPELTTLLSLCNGLMLRTGMSDDLVPIEANRSR